MVNYTLSADTYWTGGPSQGTGDGSSFANRKQAPTDISTLTVDRISDSDYATLYLVREVQNAQLLGAATASSEDIIVYGGIRTITDASFRDDTASTFTWDITGRTGSTHLDRVQFDGREVALSYCRIANGLGDTTSGNRVDIISMNDGGFPGAHTIFYKCDIGSSLGTERTTVYGEPAFIDCNFNTSIFGKVINTGSTRHYIEGLTQNLAGGGAADRYANGRNVSQVYYQNGNLWSGCHAYTTQDMTVYRTAMVNVMVEDTSSNPLPSIEVVAYTKEGAAPFKAITNASGITLLEGFDGFNQYRRGSIPVSWYKHVITGAFNDTHDLETGTGGDEQVLSNATFKTRFVAFDPAGAYTTTTLSTVVTGNLSATIQMPTGGATPSITIDSVAIRPDPPEFDKEFAVNLTTSSAAALSAIQLVDTTTGKIQATRAAVNSSTSASALFPAGTCATGTSYTIKGLIASDGGELGDIDTDSTFSVTDTFEPNLMVTIKELFDDTLGSEHAQARITTQEWDDEMENPMIVLVEGRTDVPSQYFSDPVRRATTRVFIDTYVSNQGGRMDSYQSSLTSIKAKLEALDQETRRMVMANKDNPRSHIQRIEYIGVVKNPTIYASHKQRIFSHRHELKVTWWSTNV